MLDSWAIAGRDTEQVDGRAADAGADDGAVIPCPLPFLEPFPSLLLVPRTTLTHTDTDGHRQTQTDTDTHNPTLAIPRPRITTPQPEW